MAQIFSILSRTTARTKYNHLQKELGLYCMNREIQKGWKNRKEVCIERICSLQKSAQNLI